jgi:hypothetical protein
MKTDDLERVKTDLATMKLALAPDLPFKPTTVRFAFALALGGVLSLVWAVHPYPVPPKWSIAVPVLLQVLPMLVTLVHFAIVRKPGDCSVSAGEAKRAHMNYIPYIVAILSLPFLMLASRTGWMPVGSVSPIFLFFFGAAITAVAATEPRQRFNLGLSIPMLLFAGAGLVLKWPHYLMLGLAFSTGGLALAFMMIVQLRRQAKNHAAH